MNEHLRAVDATTPPDEGIGGIAIIAMAGRFPGAPSVDELWEMIREGRHAFRQFRPDELEDAFDDAVRASKDYVAARPHLDDVGLFDAEFFGMYPREAALVDPQFRIFLETCWEALESAGCDPFGAPGPIGVFAGSAMGTYLINNVLADRERAAQFTSNYQVGMFSELIGSINDTLATRVAYKLDLRGPAFTIQSACSTSALAIAQACQSLLTYGCDMALAGGVSITFPQKRGYIHQEGGMVSPDGVCRPFDAAAGGTVFGSGVGVVLLKRLDEAVRDGDTVHAVIRGYGINNDGADKVGYTAPSVSGQAAAIAAAHASAGVDPASIGYVECHGTATPLGDPIEFSGLCRAFGGASSAGSCALGSVKGNLGHLDAAAGVAGVIKAALVLRHGQIPPVANFVAPNPRIELAGSPFTIPQALGDWSAGDTPRRAGVSSFGVGGTNVHLVLEEAPPSPPPAGDDSDTPYILPLSARDETALAAMRGNLAGALRGGAPLAAAAYTLQRGRRDFRHRSAVVARTRAEAVAALEGDRPIGGIAPDTPPPVILLFPGQGAQYVGMGGPLYAAEPEFARWIDQGSELLRGQLDVDLRDFIRPPEASTASAEALRDTRIAQPALFLVEYATARLWMSRGLVPAAMIGHSLGEFVAATLAGTMSFEDGLTLVAARGRLMQDQPKGAMVSVRAPVETVEPQLCQGAEIAAINAPKLCVISGPFAAIDATCSALQAADIAFSRLHTSHAFHSAMMDEAAAALEAETAKVSYGEAAIPYISCVTGDWQTDAQGASPAYWARHCRDAVRFADGLATACGERRPVLLETGPGRTLSVFAAQTMKRDAVAAIVQSLPEHDRAERGEDAFAEAHARLWCAGCGPDWPQPPARARRRIPLPTYPFQRQLHWIEAPKPARAIKAGVGEPAGRMPTTPTNGPEAMNAALSASTADRPARLAAALLALLADLSGEELPPDAGGATFLELGFDSLFIGQFAQKVEREYKVKLSFRELLSNIPTIQHLARHLDAELPADAVQPAPETPVTPVPPTPAAALAAPSPIVNGTSSASSGLEALFQSQLQMAQQLFAQQMQTMQSLGGAAVPPPAVPAAEPAAARPVEDGETEIGGDRIRLYKPGAQPAEQATTPEKSAFIAELTRRYAERNARSKAFTQTHRPHLADPRAASGFRAEWKELVFPVVADRCKGSRIWDVDGNEYIDLVNGMGQTAFGHAPDFVVKAMHEQIDRGFAIGPQTPLAGEVAALISELTGHERVTFCNTGSEAVMAAMRVARTVTGRERVVVFGNDYHGQFDEVLVKGRRSGSHAALPVAAGIPPGSLANMTVLGYGAPESLDWLRANANDVAAIIIEPVQSRHPELRPVDFVRELRAIATAGDCALVFDEVVTGFRVDPGGMQAVWGIRGDLATYGKVLGGGMPIGVLAGDSRFMDALDGGGWRYGDDSVPMVAPTFFAGTFVRHPIVLAAARAVLEHIKGDGQALYERVAARTEKLVADLNRALSRRGIAAPIHGYKSWFVTDFGSVDPLGALFYPQARLQGLHVQDGYPCFLTTEHSEEDFQRIADIFSNSLDALQAVGILAPTGTRAAAETEPAPTPEPAVDAAPSSAGLTEAQKEIWLAAQAGDEASCAFNESFNLTLDGPLDVSALRRAFDLVIGRHDALHIRFARAGDRFETVPDFRVDLPLHEASDAAEIDGLTDREARTPFDLVNGPLVRALLVKVADERHVLIFTAHHIVCDGWSVNVIVSEIATAYSALTRGAEPELPPASSFAAYALEAAREGSPSGGGETERFWLGQFETVPDLPDLPTDRPRPERRSFAGGTVTARIDAEVHKRLRKAGAKSGATLFSTLLALLQVALARLSGSSDIVVAVPSAGQSLLGEQVLVGHCVNLLPLRQTVSDDTPFEAHLRATQQLVLQAFEHQDYTYGTLVRKLGLKRDPSRLPLTEIQFNLERVAGNLDFAGIRARVTPNAKAFVNFDLFLNMIEGDDGIRIDADYNGDVFDRRTVERWLDHLRTLAAAAADRTTAKIGALPLLSDAQADWLINTLNATDADFDQDRLVHDLFAERAAETPDAIAVVHGDASITYAELDAQSWQLAHLIHEKVFIPGRRIAVALDRSIDMVVALLAIMKAGHIYVPLDPDHPPARLQRTMEAARISALVCAGDRIAALAGKDAIIIRLDTGGEALDAESPAPLERRTRHAASTAYIIFTSGSTGTPKGVEVPHRALMNFLTSMAREPGFTANDVMLAVTTVSFDIAGLELYLPLITGGRVVIADRAQVQDGFALIDLLKRSGATVMQATPTLWQILVEAGLKDQPNLTMLCGGEPLPGELAGTLTRIGAALWNLYGPTETTIWSSLGRIDDAEAPITIGHPIANTQLHVLDKGDRIAPVGVPGELNIGGEGLAIGYFDNVEQTRAAFRHVNIAGVPQRLYRTGDLARRLPDGSLQLLGRRDNQIKLRGFRIELGEIEAVIGKADGVRQCAVVAAGGKGGDRHLVCHFVPQAPDASPTAEALAAHAQLHLPSHMVPAHWVETSSLPQTANGKLDRRALADLGVPQRRAAPIRTPPRTPMEEKLSHIWREVLEVGDIGIEDNLYALGADSLSIFRIAARMMDAGVPLEAKHLLRHPTIGELARCAEQESVSPMNGAAPHVPSLREFRNGARRVREVRQ